MLTGKFTKQAIFEADDHRSFNKDGEHFNVGETFAGVEFSKGVELSEQLSWIADGRGNMTRAALRWILDHDEITTVIPGFKTVKQVEDNLQATEVKSFSEAELKQLSTFYQQEIHPTIRGAY